MEEFPKLDLFPRLTKVGNAISSLVRHLPHEGYPSDHRRGDVERDLGHKVLSGELTAEEAYERLGE